MIVRINGEEISNVKRLEINQEASNAKGLVVVAAGLVACILWWHLWA